MDLCESHENQNYVEQWRVVETKPSGLVLGRKWICEVSTHDMFAGINKALWL